MDRSLDYQYLFLLPEGREVRVAIAIEPHTMILSSLPDPPWPVWTGLAFHQCPNCPLAGDALPACPAALALLPVVRSFGGLASHDPVQVEIITPERRISQGTTAQRAIGSLAGLLLAVSGCPRTAFFRPMARFHLPLASEAETTYRAASMYLMAQYFRRRDGQEPDHDFAGLAALYQEIQAVNAALAKRLRAATETDSSVNAIILLDMYAKAMPYVIRDAMEELRYLFASYCENDSCP
ncbi:MAG: hypothetical protein AB1634_04670 [Thermodesulfobacteriota bacterium]